MEIIEMHRGDFTAINIRIEDKSKELMSEFDEIYFTVKKSPYHKDFLIQKTLNNGITINDDGTYRLEINPEDTEDLEYGDYAFDFELNSSNPKIKQTFLGTLCLDKEVTYSINEEV